MLIRSIGFLLLLYLSLAVRTPALVATATHAGATYADQPLPQHTGGFGEETCHTCHFAEPLNAPGGTLTLEGVPPAYTPDTTYRLTVRLEKPGMRRGGFQLAGRFADGAAAGQQAGTLRPVDAERAAVTPAGSTAVQYAHHTLDGTALAHPDAAAWTLEWTPPDTARGPVVFHAAANAANDDASAFGDFVYTQQTQSRPAQP